MILNAIESSARKAKGVGGLLLLLLKGLLGLAWTVLTFFVIPIIVYQDLGVVDTIKKSGETIKKTWGEALMVNFSAGFVFGILIVLWLIVGFVLMAGLATVQPLLALVVLLLIIFGLVMIMLIQATVTSIYKTLLYLYAEQGVVPPGFSESEMQGMFRK